ncbi:MAG TPA: glycosyltransferase family 2 protein [Bacteroidia bacterium]|nr:glycosyltransferase family 2 protein [Bacteroidia bacterium]HNT79135.1 glycosyltransferase family 2 protein [Bacteroidia bacterium]
MTKLSGFTFVRNAIQFAYPVEASIRSALPLVDEMIVLCGNSTDRTRDLIESINDPKIKIIDSVWDDSKREGGMVLAQETNKAFDRIDPSSKWALYLQADEVLHEKDYTHIQNALTEFENDEQVDGLLFSYLHFYGNYYFIGASRKWYRNEIRIIKNDPEIKSFRDAQGFRKGNRKLQVKAVNASVYHYGWVKHPREQQLKQKSFHKMWHDDQWVEKKTGQQLEFDYSQIDLLRRFEGTHPGSMKTWIEKMNWDFEYDPSQITMTMKDRLLYSIEKYSGWRPGEYKNYRLI